MKYLLLIPAFLFLFGTASVAFAQADPTTSAATALQAAHLENPLGANVTDVRVVIGRIISAILGVTGALALLMFIWGGIIWMTSQGEKARVEKGQKTLSWAVIGLAVIFTAYAGVRWVITALTQATG